MLLRHIILLIHIPLQRSENIPLAHQILPALPLHVQKMFICDPGCVCSNLAIFWGNGKVFQLLAENYDGLF